MLAILVILYSGLFSLYIGANFPEFHKWANSSEKFILGYCIKFDCGLLLQNLVWAQLCPDRSIQLQLLGR